MSKRRHQHEGMDLKELAAQLEDFITEVVMWPGECIEDRNMLVALVFYLENARRRGDNRIDLVDSDGRRIAFNALPDWWVDATIREHQQLQPPPQRQSRPNLYVLPSPPKMT